jgi:hypothetical protein
MNFHETRNLSAAPLAWSPAYAGRPVRRMIRRALLFILTFYLTLLLAGGSSIPAAQVTIRRLNATVNGLVFNIVKWEVEALTRKISAAFQRPATTVAPSAQTALVRAYLERAEHIRQLQAELARLAASPVEPQPALSTLQEEITQLRLQQAAERPAVEQIIEQQVAMILAAEGLAWGDISLPPVQFAFVEPPKKLVVSPRERIDTVYAQMLDEEITLAQVERIEEQIRQEEQLSAYVTGIGGLGAYPTMVIDDASLPWILSTVAHEWVHNYLTFFPLGFNYGVNGDIITINETVAELVGNELGEQALRRFYPDLAPPPALPEISPAPVEPPAFDFNAAMRQTRLTVDALLAQGKVEQAERYMEAQRQRFVERGYPIRVLNQAYFAFHGSYGTTAASTSPLGPKLEQLRALTPDVKTFLQTVRSFTTPADVDTALAEWAGH